MSLSATRVSLDIGDSTLLDNVTMHITPGQVSVVAGPNGAGKSTLLRVLSGDLNPTAGDVTLNGDPLSAVSDREQAKSRAVMTQTSPMVFDYTVAEVLRMGWVGSDIWDADAEAMLNEVVTQCDVRRFLDRRINTLSGGEQQRIHFARAQLQIAGPNQYRPRYLLLDEPTSNLDLAQELRLLSHVRRLATSGLGVLMVLHDLNLAARFADEIHLLSNGQIVESGCPASVLRPDPLEAIYQTPVVVEYHDQLQRLVVLTR
ncbi:MAG: heme ABC transporter ATP-binding protein [Pseudomonadota bacterium]